MIGTLACDEGPTPPEPLPGELLVTLVSPGGAEGAAVFETADDGLVEAAAAVDGANLAGPPTGTSAVR